MSFAGRSHDDRASRRNGCGGSPRPRPAGPSACPPAATGPSAARLLAVPARARSREGRSGGGASPARERWTPPAGGQPGSQLETRWGSASGALEGQVGQKAHTGGEHQVLAGWPFQNILEPVLERLVSLGGDPVDGALGAPSLPGGLDRLDPSGRMQLLDGPVEGAGPALGVVLVPLVHQPLHLVRVEGALAEQGEGGQGDHPLGRSGYALRHIA